jgi:hypothetical protein
MLAEPLASALDATGAPSTRKVTVPVGTGAPEEGAAGDTAAVKVTVWPNVEEPEGVADSVVAVAARVIVNALASLLAVFVASPGNDAVTVYAPGGCVRVSEHEASPDPSVVPEHDCVPRAKLIGFPARGPDVVLSTRWALSVTDAKELAVVGPV